MAHYLTICGVRMLLDMARRGEKLPEDWKESVMQCMARLSVGYKIMIERAEERNAELQEIIIILKFLEEYDSR